MAQRIPTLRRPIELAMSLAGGIALLGFASWGAWGSRNAIDLSLVIGFIGYAVFLGWFGTGVALALRHRVFRWFLVSAWVQVALLAAFGIGLALNPEAMFRSWPLVGGLLTCSLGTCAVIGFLTAAIGWWDWFHQPRAEQST